MLFVLFVSVRSSEQIQLHEETGKVVPSLTESEVPLVALQITSYGKSWVLRRSYEHFRLLDEQLHRCIYDRKFSQLPLLPENVNQPAEVNNKHARPPTHTHMQRVHIHTHTDTLAVPKSEIEKKEKERQQPKRKYTHISRPYVEGRAGGGERLVKSAGLLIVRELDGPMVRSFFFLRL